MKNNLSAARCSSCDGTGVPERLHPFCSVVCRTLGHAGLAWQTNPCRIVDVQSGVTVNNGPVFDLTDKGIADLQKHADRLQDKTRIGSSTPWVSEDVSPVLVPITRIPVSMSNAEINLHA